jgi:class 3 adenylate cyclase/pimeloyl-ACP methyl ester carboxylesterase
VERKLTAILCADVHGYSRLMGEREEATLRTLTSYRKLIDGLIQHHRGRFVNSAGDSVVAEFASVVDAVRCAAVIQTTLRAENANLPADQRMEFRIGVNLGDVMVEGEQIYGDGVNVAARLESLAEPGGICISGTVREHLGNKLALSYEDLGVQTVKNIAEPVRVLRVLEPGASVPAARTKTQRIVRKPLLAVAIATLIVLVGYGVYWSYRAQILAAKEIYLPRILPKAVEQRIAFCTTSDGVHIAYASSGKGPPLVIILGWITHLERGLLSPAYFGGLHQLGTHHLVVRYDGRGFGLSDRAVSDYSLNARVRDLEAVTEALKLKRFSIWAISMGGPTAIAYAARHPEKVSRLVLYGSYARMIRDVQDRQKWEAMITLIRTGWGSDNSAYRQMFTSLFMPDGTEVDQRLFNEMQRVAATPEDAAAFVSITMDIGVRDLARQVQAPTLVAQVRGDQVVPFDLGRELAALVPGARLVVIEGRDHATVPGDGEREQMAQAVFPFLDEDLQAQSQEQISVHPHGP